MNPTSGRPRPATGSPGGIPAAVPHLTSCTPEASLVILGGQALQGVAR